MKRWFSSEFIHAALVECGLVFPYNPGQSYGPIETKTITPWDMIEDFRGVPHVFKKDGVWWYRNSDGQLCIGDSVRTIQMQYEMYEPDPRYWRSLPRTFKGISRTCIGDNIRTIKMQYTGGER